VQDDLRVAVVGLGRRGMVHVRTLVTLGHAPAAVDHHRPHRESAVAAGAAQALPDLAGLLAETRLNLVVVATPPRDHSPSALLAARAGAAVLIEKPVAVSPAAAACLEPHASSIGVGHSERWNPAVLAVRRALLDGVLGSVRSTQFVRHSPEPRHASIGVDLDLAVHDLDLARWLFGPPRIQARWVDQPARPARATLRATAGEGTAIEISVAWASRVHRTVRIEGERGVLEADLRRGTAWSTDRAGWRVPLPTATVPPVTAMLRDVIVAVEAGLPLPVPLADGVAAVSDAVGAGAT
jgi:predicted dehydrogenase